jgi:hypothetical protein
LAFLFGITPIYVFFVQVAQRWRSRFCLPAEVPRFIEIHEQTWFPDFLRDGVTDGLQAVLNFGGVYRTIVGRLNQAIHESRASRVVDLCSGGGGPWPWLYAHIRDRAGEQVEVVLTDKFPNLAAFKRAFAQTRGRVEFLAEAVDANNPRSELHGFRTLFGSFHHLGPRQAQAILQAAVDQHQGIGVFEVARRHPLAILSTLLMPLGAFLTTPFIRPFRFSRLFWTYVLPVIPFVLFFDGVISCLRAYSQKELRALVEQFSSIDYVWEIGEERGSVAPITYLIGYPSSKRGGCCS